MIERWGGWLILFGLLIATTLLLYNMGEDFQVDVTGQALPDYTLTHFTTTSMNEQGGLKHRVVAETMTHYPKINTVLTAPVLTFYKDGQPTWIVQAEQGEVAPDNNQIWLLGATTLQKPAVAPQDAIKIVSRDVYVVRDTEFAETQAPATVFNGYGETYSIGMRVFMATEQVELLSKVRGQYAVQ